MDSLMSKSSGRLNLKAIGTMGTVYFILGLMILVPAVHLFLSSFRIDTVGKPSIWTLSNYYNELIRNVRFISALKNTLILCVGVVILSTIWGVTMAWLMARTDMPFKKVLEPLNLLPFYLSSLVGALSWEVLAAPKSGILNYICRDMLGLTYSPFNIYTMTGMILVLSLFFTPYVYLFVVGSFRNMDPSLEDAGRVSGASTAHTMLRITLPLSSPAIFSACILVFVLTGGAFGVPLILGGPGRFLTLSTLIWSYIEGYPPNYNVASALSSILIIITAAMLILQYKILARRHYWTVTGKGFRPRLISLGRWRWFALSINLTYLAAVLIPILTLLFVSLIPGYRGGLRFSEFSLSNYKAVLFVHDLTRRALFNSSFIAILGASIGVAVCMFLATLVSRSKLPGRSGIDYLVMSTVAFPGIALGMSLLVAWIRTPLYGTLWILMLAYIIQFMPTSLRSIEATLGAISPDLDECARVCGAGWFSALRRILLPLMWPGLMSAWLLLFVTFMRDIGASIMLFTHGTEPISVALIQLMEYDTQGICAAYGMVLTLIILITVYIFRKITASSVVPT